MVSRGPFCFFLLSSVVKHPKFESGTLWVKQILAMSKKTKGGGASMLSQTRVLSQIIKTIEGGTFGEKKLRKKSHKVEKTEKEDPLGSAGIVCYAEKQKKHFWLSSLGQMIQFGTI